MREISEVDSFLQTMGPGKSRIPVVYPARSSSVIIEDGIKTDLTRKMRYERGRDVIFKCLDCNDIIGQGKETTDNRDQVKIYCFKCRNYHIANGALIWNQNPLWHKPEEGKQRQDYEKLMEEYIKNNKPKVVGI